VLIDRSNRKNKIKLKIETKVSLMGIYDSLFCHNLPKQRDKVMKEACCTAIYNKEI